MVGSGEGSGRPLVEVPPALVFPEGGLDGGLTGFIDSSIADLRSSLSSRISHSSLSARTLQHDNDDDNNNNNHNKNAFQLILS